MLDLDVETCGLTGPIITMQAGLDDDEPYLYHLWDFPVEETLDLLESYCNETVCAYNLAFDWFHINKMYNILKEVKNKEKPPQVWEIEQIERSHPCDYCLKPAGALDLFSYARTDPLQYLLVGHKERDIKIEKVPKKIAYLIRPYLPVPWEIFHAKWEIEELRGDLVNLVLKLRPTTALKPIIKHLFPDTPTIDYPIPKRLLFSEQEWKPLGQNWPMFIAEHIKYWKTNEQAQKYALDDIYYLKLLREHWELNPGQKNYHKINSDNDILCIQTACSRWRGFEVDIDEIKKQIEKFTRIRNAAPRAPLEARQYILGDRKIGDVPQNRILAEISLPNTQKSTLEKVARQENDIGERANAVLAARKADKRLDVLKKLITAKRFHPQFIVPGTKSNRMAGTGGLNAQGIPRDDEIRKCFRISSGGDFEAFEVTIIDAVFPDPTLHTQLLQGLSIHGLLGTLFYDKTYNEIMETKGTTKNIYNPAKNTVFAYFYGADIQKMAETAGVEYQIMELAVEELAKRYPGVSLGRKAVFDQFCSVSQPRGMGTEVIWKDPAPYVEALTGHRRYYTLENQIIKRLFELAGKLPPAWERDELGNILTVERRSSRGPQSLLGATRSALYSTVFRLQQRNMRTAANHKIQAAGAEITKRLQAELWSLQPIGAHRWVINLFNEHDEILAEHDPSINEQMQSIIDDVITKYRKQIPLLSINWKFNLSDWSQK